MGEHVDPVVGRADDRLIGLLGRARGLRCELTGHDVDATDLGWVPPRVTCGAVDQLLRRRDLGGRYVDHHRGHPAISGASGERQSAGLCGAEPDPNRVRRPGTRLHALKVIVPAVVANRPGGVPALPEDLHSLLQRFDALARSELGGAHRVRGLEITAAAETRLEPAAAEHVQRGCGLREDRRRSQREVSHRREHADPLGSAKDHADQRESIQMPPLVWVVLDPEHVVPELVGQAGCLQNTAGITRVRCQEVTELHRVSVVGHFAHSSFGDLEAMGSGPRFV